MFTRKLNLLVCTALLLVCWTTATATTEEGSPRDSAVRQHFRGEGKDHGEHHGKGIVHWIMNKMHQHGNAGPKHHEGKAGADAHPRHHDLDGHRRTEHHEAPVDGEKPSEERPHMGFHGRHHERRNIEEPPKLHAMHGQAVAAVKPNTLEATTTPPRTVPLRTPPRRVSSTPHASPTPTTVGRRRT